MGQKQPKINLDDAISIKQAWQREERAAWVKKHGKHFESFARAVAQAVTERAIGIRFPDGRVRVTPSQLVKDYGCGLDAIHNALRDIASVDVQKDVPIWSVGTVQTREAQPGRGKVEQEWQFPCLVPPPPVVLAWMAATATGEARTDYSMGSIEAEATGIERPRRQRTADLSAPGGHHNHRSSSKTSSSQKTTPPTRPVEVGGVVSGSDALQEIEPLLTESMQRLVERFGTLPDFIRLNPRGARKAVLTLRPEEVECLLSAGDAFWEAQAKEIQAGHIEKSGQAILFFRLTDPQSRKGLLRQIKESKVEHQKAVLSGRAAPDSLTLPEAYARWRAQSAQEPREESPGYHVWLDATSEAFGAIIGALRMRFQAEYQEVETEVLRSLREGGDIREGSLVWKRAFNTQLKKRVLTLLPKLLADAS